MSAPASSTRIFGIRVGVNPKYLIAALVAVATLLFWINSRSDSEATPADPRPLPSNAAAPTPVRAPRPVRRANANAGSERNVLVMKPVDASRGDIDPTLRLELLSRLKRVEAGPIGRSLFEIGSAAQQSAAAAPIKAPKIAVTPILPPVLSAPPGPPAVNIPLKYYGYAKPGIKNELNRGLFLDGENVLVAAEGQTVKGRYLVVELTPNSARMEDTQLKQGQTLPVVPQAQQQ